MYCDYYEEDMDCNECSRDCSEREGVEAIPDTELVAEVRKALAKVLGMEDGQLDTALKRFTSATSDSLRNIITGQVNKLVASLWQEQLEKETEAHIQRVFQEALTEKIVTEEAKGFVQKECQSIVLSRVKQWLSSNWDSERKRKEIINKSLSNMIADTVDKNVDEAINEIKEETIEKFQKDVMKKMMLGMAREIGSDKKLLALMTNDL